MPDPIVFMHDCRKHHSGRLYDDFLRLLFLHAHREANALAGDQFRFLRTACLANLKGSVGLILAKASAMRVTIPFDLSTRPIIPLLRFIRSRLVVSPLFLLLP
jgi:hypothetical protein